MIRDMDIHPPPNLTRSSARPPYAWSLTDSRVPICTASFAQDVFVTKYGKKYHKAGSKFIKDKEVTKMTREEAEELGYKPSSEILKDDEVSKEAKSKK